jgi:hypothetical protein
MKRSQTERLRQAGFVQGKSKEVIWSNTLDGNWETVERHKINWKDPFIELIDAPTIEEMMTWLMPEIMSVHPQPSDGKLVWVVDFINEPVFENDVEDENLTEVLVKAIEKVLGDKQK